MVKILINQYMYLYHYAFIKFISMCKISTVQYIYVYQYAYSQPIFMYSTSTVYVYNLNYPCVQFQPSNICNLKNLNCPIYVRIPLCCYHPYPCVKSQPSNIITYAYSKPIFMYNISTVHVQNINRPGI